MYEDIISGCTLFRGLDREQLKNALGYFGAVEKKYARGEFLNRVSAPLEHFGLVLSGAVQVYMDELDGSHLIMASVRPGETFGESLCFLQWEAPVYICAMTDATVLWMSTHRLQSGSGNPWDAELASRFTAMLAGRALAMNDRIQVLSKLTIREKLMTFFSQQIAHTGRRELKLPFNREDMAIYLGVNRSALSRELAKMQQEGILEYHRDVFLIRK